MLPTLLLRSSLSREKGFTLIELLAVVTMVGILAAIAAPSWLATVQKNRLNASQSKVFSAIKAAQSVAKLCRRTTYVAFRQDGDTVLIGQYFDPNTPAFNGNQSGGGQCTVNKGFEPIAEIGAKNNLIELRELTPGYTGGGVSNPDNCPVVAGLPLSAADKCIRFDAKGQFVGQSNIRVALRIRNTGLRRCVRFTTLLGAIDTETERDSSCSS